MPIGLVNLIGPNRPFIEFGGAALQLPRSGHMNDEGLDQVSKAIAIHLCRHPHGCPSFVGFQREISAKPLVRVRRRQVRDGPRHPFR